MDLWFELLQQSVKTYALGRSFSCFCFNSFREFRVFRCLRNPKICVICAICVRLKEFVQFVFDLNALNT